MLFAVLQASATDRHVNIVRVCRDMRRLPCHELTCNAQGDHYSTFKVLNSTLVREVVSSKLAKWTGTCRDVCERVSDRGADAVSGPEQLIGATCLHVESVLGGSQMSQAEGDDATASKLGGEGKDEFRGLR